ncbi:MAG: glycerophosphodiester phosphodiesterase [Verrucomicrobia bacterium]|nr:glycerophosphodiester phosphodiesterase [Verrucomicrobiota bacterium]
MLQRRGRNVRHLFSLAAVGLLTAMIAGCAMPRYTISLDDVIEQEGMRHRTRYGYRCTAGAHRGASERHRENTMAALKAADADSKYAFVEFDVQYSKDGTIVVFHDKRMLRQFGSLKAIGNTTFAQLSDIAGGDIAAYGDAMDVLTQKLIIEIKSQGDIHEDARLVDQIVADIRTRKRHNDVMISSISSEVVEYVNRKYPEIPTGQVFWLTSSTYLHIDSLTEALYENIRSTQADYIMLHIANLRNIEDLLRLKPRKKTIVFWDFDETMYLVHKDLSDRMCGDSGCKTFCQFLRYELMSPFYRFTPGK